MVFAAWQWRKELGFDSFGFISKQPEITGTNPDDRVNDEGDTPPDAPTPPITNYQPTAGNDEYTNFQLTEKIKINNYVAFPLL